MPEIFEFSFSLCSSSRYPVVKKTAYLQYKFSLQHKIVACHGSTYHLGTWHDVVHV